MTSLSEVRRVRHAMSAAVGHDVRKLMLRLNERREEVRARIIAPGAAAETCGVPRVSQPAIPSEVARPKGPADIS